MASGHPLGSISIYYKDGENIYVMHDFLSLQSSSLCYGACD